MIADDFIREFLSAAVRGGEGEIAPAALQIARLSYPRLDATRYLETLDTMGADVARQLREIEGAPAGSAIAILSRYLFEELGFTGNTTDYEDSRNSMLNEVIDRRTGIPITLGVVYIEVARRAGVRVEGVNFPGHFLLRHFTRDKLLIIDPFHDGRVMSEQDCRELFARHAGEDATFEAGLLAPASRQQILIRMLGNLKRNFVRLRSFPQARDVIELLLALDQSALTELRDRGLVAYQLNDFSTALRDLEMYLRLATRGESEQESREERDQIWEHVKTLKRRVASLN